MKNELAQTIKADTKPIARQTAARRFWGKVGRGATLLTAGLMLAPALARADETIADALNETKTNPLAWNPASAHNNTVCSSLLGKNTWLILSADFIKALDRMPYAGTGIFVSREIGGNFVDFSAWGGLKEPSKIENVKAGFSTNAGPISFGIRGTLDNTGEKVTTGIEAGTGISGIAGPVGIIAVASAGLEKKGAVNIILFPLNTTLSAKVADGQKPMVGADVTFLGDKIIRGGVGEGFRSVGVEFYVTLGDKKVCVDADWVVRPGEGRSACLVLGF